LKVLSDILSHVTAACTLMEDNDLDMNQSSLIQGKVMVAVACYEELSQEKKRT